MHLIQSDLKGPGYDLICLQQLSVPAGLVFEEGGESSLNLPLVCWSKSNRLAGCGDGWLSNQSLFHSLLLIPVSQLDSMHCKGRAATLCGQNILWSSRQQFVQFWFFTEIIKRVLPPAKQQDSSRASNRMKYLISWLLTSLHLLSSRLSGMNSCLASDLHGVPGVIFECRITPSHDLWSCKRFSPETTAA